MTHDELLTRINGDLSISGYQFMGALTAVVRLHKPDESDFPDEWENCVECSIGGLSAFYPCNTIQAIEKELYG